MTSPLLPERVLVTGGAGFIGSNLVKAILARYSAAHVTVLDDLSSGDSACLPAHEPRLTFVEGDVGAAPLAKLFPPGSFDAIFHLGAITDTTVTDEKEMRRVNVTGSRHIFEYAAAGKIPVVYASSAAVYGITESRCAETSPLKPANIYGVSKMEAEKAAAEYVVRGARLAGVRFFNVYGPGEFHKGKFASMIYQLSLQMKAGKRPRIFKHGEQKRDFVHIEDVVESTIRTLSAPPGTVVNVGSGKARSFNDVVAALNAALDTRLEPDYFDCPYDFFQPFTEADVTRLAQVTGYAPRWNLEDGVAAYMKSIATSGATGRS